MNRRSFFAVFKVLAAAPVVALLAEDVGAEQLEAEVRPDLMVFTDRDGSQYGILVSPVQTRHPWPRP